MEQSRNVLRWFPTSLFSSRTRSLRLILFITIFAGSSSAILLVIMIYREGVLTVSYSCFACAMVNWFPVYCLTWRCAACPEMINSSEFSGCLSQFLVLQSLVSASLAVSLLPPEFADWRLWAYFPVRTRSKIRSCPWRDRVGVFEHFWALEFPSWMSHARFITYF